MSDEQAVTPNASNLRRMALVALLLMIVGATMLTMGITLAFGVPIGLTTLGAIILSGGVILGLMT